MKRISDNIKNTLDILVQFESDAEELYRHMSNVMDQKGYFGAAKFYKGHAEEELAHRKKLYEFMLDRDVIPKPPKTNIEDKDYSLLQTLEDGLAHEIKGMKLYERAVDSCLKEKDYSTKKFLDWYLKEQVEEESIFLNFLTRYGLTKENPAAILMLDKEMGDE